MAIRTDEDLNNIFKDVIEDVVEAVSERAKKLLRQHINTDTYGIGRNAEFSLKKINESYLDGTGTPSYEFRDQAWDTLLRETVRGYTFSIFYEANNLTPPSPSSPYLHGNAYKNMDRRDILPYLLNVSGTSLQSDMNDNKIRNPFWDNFINELRQKIGGWLYTEFNNRGFKIPALKLYKGSFTE